MAYFKCGSGGSSVEIDGGSYDGDLKLKKVVSHVRLPNLPVNVYSGSSAVLKDKLSLFSGASHFVWDGEKWTQLSNAPMTISYNSSVTWNEKIHCFYNQNHYAWDGETWTKVSAIPSNFYYHGTVVFNDSVHLLGGYNSTLHYSWNGTTWTSKTSIPYGFKGQPASAAVFDGKIHVMGSSDSSYDNYHYAWDGETWTKIGLLSQVHRGGTALVFDNCIHLIGNDYYSSGVSPMSVGGHLHYKFDGTEWELCENLPYYARNNTATVYKKVIHVMGGNNLPSINTMGNVYSSTAFYMIDASLYSQNE